MKSRTCKYCNRIGTDQDMVEFGKPTQSVPGVRLELIREYICAPETGCQKSYQHTWGGYFAGSFIYDIPFLFLGLLMISGFDFLLTDVLTNVLGADIWIAKAMFYGGMTLFPVAMALVCGLPIFISPVVLAIFSFWMIQK